MTNKPTGGNVNPMKRVPIQDPTAYLDAIWRGLSPAEMRNLGRELRSSQKVKGERDVGKLNSDTAEGP